MEGTEKGDSVSTTDNRNQPPVTCTSASDSNKEQGEVKEDGEARSQLDELLSLEPNELQEWGTAWQHTEFKDAANAIGIWLERWGG